MNKLTLLALSLLIGFSVFGNDPKEDLLSLKEEAKSLLYNDPAQAVSLFSELKTNCTNLFNSGDITEVEYQEFLGHAATGTGNYHLIATGNVDSAFHFYDLAIGHYKKANHLPGIGSIHNNKGVILEQLSLQDSALLSYDSAIYYYNKNNDLKSSAKTYGNIGNIYIDKGNFPLAQSYYLKSNDCATQIQDTLELAYTYFGLGNIAKLTKNVAEAEAYYQKALDAFVNTEDLFGLSSAYFSMANVYKDQFKVDSAYFLYHRTLNTFKKAGYQSSMAQCHINLAVLYNEYYDSVVNYPEVFDNEHAEFLVQCINETGLDSARYHSDAAISISKAVSKHYLLIYAYICKGTVENLANNYTQSLSYADSAYTIIKQGDYRNEFKQMSHLKYNSYKGLNNHEKALFWHETYVHVKDSLYNLDKAEELIQQKFQFDYEKQKAQDSIVQAEELKLKNTEIELEKAESAKQKSRNTYLIIIAAVLLVMGIIIFQRLKVTQRQKKIIDEQKKEVESQKSKIELQHHQLEETHKEISDSIRYAQRLQAAILPEMNDLKAELKDGFVLFQPKDVVSGDFYWMQRTPNGVLFAAADCTGHGVPGAMVSVVCSNALNRSVKEFGLHEPAQILDKTRELVIETFDSTSADVKDGMDIALCKLEYTSEGARVTFAGANNPLWILRHHGTEIEEIKGAKQPIGKYENHTPFPQESVELKKDDCIFVFSDGYADQFGGLKGKKMKIKPFKQLLVDMSNLSMDDRKTKLMAAFNNWKGDFEQVDDVTVIGVRIS
jgi:serine phosphatase RsbU (regulator of sigma subunit)/tetratricopeptide (TPR) repeat protein